MTKRERIEDLGIIQEKLTRFFDDREDLFREFDSKHQEEKFVQKYRCEDNLYDLFYKLRGLENELWEIWGIARGEDE